jgi:hypothetical protein
MSSAEHPGRLRPQHRPSVEVVEALVAASTPHFALQLRDRIRRLIRPLAHDDRVWIAGVRAIAALELLAFSGEQRGLPPRPDLPPLKSLGPPPARLHLPSH